MSNFFANNIAFLRKSRKLTQDQVGKALNKDYSAIGKWEAGVRTPTVEDTIKVANYFDVNVTDLINKDLSIANTPKDELHILFDKYNQELTADDKAMIKFIIEKRKKEIDEQLSSNE